MGYQFAELVSRPFQDLMADAEFLASLAMELRERRESTDQSSQMDEYRRLWHEEESAARASFVLSVAGIEAFANSVMADFGKRAIADLPESMLAEHNVKTTTKWKRMSLYLKIILLPTMCNEMLQSPNSHSIGDNSKQIEIFREMVSVRNGIMHGSPQRTLYLLNLQSKSMTNSFEHNLWPLTRFPKDFHNFDCECATKAIEVAMQVRWTLCELIPTLRDSGKYFNTEQMHKVSGVIEDASLSKEQLVRDWKKYVRT